MENRENFNFFCEFIIFTILTILLNNKYFINFPVFLCAIYEILPQYIQIYPLNIRTMIWLPKNSRNTLKILKIVKIKNFI
jgi:hypothetical protein